jgi:hypothetical protein
MYSYEDRTEPSTHIKLGKRVRLATSIYSDAPYLPSAASCRSRASSFTVFPWS